MNMKVCQLYEYELYEYESQLTKTIFSQNNLRKLLTIERVLPIQPEYLNI